MWLWIWLSVVAAGIAVEVLTMSLYGTWIALSGVFAVVTWAIGAPYWVALIVIGVSLPLFILFLRRPMQRFLQKRKKQIAKETKELKTEN